MKTLYININSEPISSSDELVVMDYHDLIDDFFFYLGERIGKGCKIQNENALITDFNTPENKQDYDLILSQWNEVKRLLFSEEVTGSFNFELPSGYLHWLRYNEDYNHVYEANFSNGGENSISIVLEDLYEDSVEALQRKIMRKLKRDDLYLEIDAIVFNDEAVTRKSRIVRTIKDNYDSIGFIKFEKWDKAQNCSDEAILSNSGDSLCHPKSNSIINDTQSIDNNNNNIRSFLIFLWEKEYLFIDNNNELILRFPTDVNFGKGVCYGEIVSNYLLYIYLWKIFDYEYKRYLSQKRPVTNLPQIFVELLENDIIRVVDGNIILALKFSVVEDYGDDVEKELISHTINLSRYLRYYYTFDYLSSNKTNTLVSWGITKTYFAYITKTKLLCNRIYKKIADIDSDGNAFVSKSNAFVISDGCKMYILNQDTGGIQLVESENIPRFKDGLAKVLKKGKWGYIDSIGNLVVSYQFDEASNFSNGTASVKLNGKCYLINKRGELFEGYVPLNKR